MVIAFTRAWVCAYEWMVCNRCECSVFVSVMTSAGVCLLGVNGGFECLTLVSSLRKYLFDLANSL